MRLATSVLCLVLLAASAIGCKSDAQRQQEEMDRNQTATMQKLLTAAAERELEGGAPATVKPDAGGVGGN
jgi:Na+-transporting NADH:ubiquinone oxidoreductase subunit NqrC